ncbi:PilZ domain-containing protein [Janthinobacterium sp. 17J80-10]|uniref:PilZ domain-containing protein n=1 Tax=Janthinobacterium sp. 17J80-10 TaxID=2497863 RepID=UPI00100528A9|nr:PilZ domain-containing protein [Janthinobacterium sp. 17J80-10]QAU33737.1 PilZ domain-containing protein [Janthinobacterium sp. 17J80-10]
MLDGFKKNPVDERSSPRRPIRCKVKITGPTGQTIHGESFDLSTGGIGVVLDIQLALGAVCTVMFAPFTHGSVKSVNVTASVAYCMLNSAGFRTGFQFINIPAATTAIIASIIG